MHIPREHDRQPLIFPLQSTQIGVLAKGLGGAYSEPFKDAVQRVVVCGRDTVLNSVKQPITCFKVTRFRKPCEPENESGIQTYQKAGFASLILHYLAIPGEAAVGKLYHLVGVAERKNQSHKTYDIRERFSLN